jgi:hypothetical protein
MGSSGDRGGRGENYSLGNYYRVYAPNWVSRLYPLPLTPEEKADLKAKMQKHIK